MKPYARAERVGGQIQKVLSELLHKEIKDPRLALVTITGVKMSRDLKSARIYFSTTGSQYNQDEIAKGLDRAKGYIKRSLARELGLRYMPQIKFFYDDSFDYGSHIDQLFRMLKKNDGPDNQPPEDQ